MKPCHFFVCWQSVGTHMIVRVWAATAACAILPTACRVSPQALPVDTSLAQRGQGALASLSSAVSSPPSPLRYDPDSDRPSTANLCAYIKRAAADSEVTLEFIQRSATTNDHKGRTTHTHTSYLHPPLDDQFTLLQPPLPTTPLPKMAECCWICLSEEGELSSPCRCPRKVHMECLARWQLQQAGRSEEQTCRFCYGE